MATLPYNHIIKSLLERRHAQNSQSHYLILENMTFKQQQKLEGSIVNMNNQLNRIFSTFDPLNIILHPGCRLINIFSSHISIHNANCSFNKSKATHCKKLNEIILESSSDPRTVVIILDTSIKNNVTSSISHIHSFNNPLNKMLHYAVNVMLMKVKLFAIRCGINQAVQIQHAWHIIVITDAIHAAKKIFNLSMHLYQQQKIAISKDLRVFLSKHEDNTIEFWNCPNDK